MEKMNNLRSDKFKDRCDSITNLSFERDSNTFGFSWPHRNYTCSFCKKQFTSAQALGGHMNIHRRERAKLRQSPSWDCPNLSFSPNPNPNPNPKPNLSSSLSPAARFLPYLSHHSSLTSFSSLSSASTDEEKRVFKPQFQIDPASPPRGDLPKKVSIGAFLGVGQLKSFEEESRVLKDKENIVRLELGMGLLRDVKEDLDLELRLGCS